MNKKVYKTSMILVLCFILGIYLLKCFNPNDFLLVIENQRVIKIGNFIDEHKFINVTLSFIIAFIFDYLYFGAVCKRKWVGKPLFIIIFLYNLFYVSFYRLASQELLLKTTNLLMALSTCYMIFIPMFFTKTIKELSITYSLNYIAQALTLDIRNISLMMTQVNFATTFLMSLECYLWMLFCYMYFNGKERL